MRAEQLGSSLLASLSVTSDKPVINLKQAPLIQHLPLSPPLLGLPACSNKFEHKFILPPAAAARSSAQMRMEKRSRSSSRESPRRRRESPATPSKRGKRESSREAGQGRGDVKQEKAKEIKSTAGTDGRVHTSTVVDVDGVISDEEMEAMALLDSEQQEEGMAHRRGGGEATGVLSLRGSQCGSVTW